MTEKAHRALLPAGLADILPPEAEHEAHIREGLVHGFALHGYDRVKPPMIEFEENLITGSGAATAAQTFRMMDPVSQRMLGVRADMTLQIARIAATRLADAARPLRLSYAGEVLRVRGSTLRPERQFDQVGAELIGSSSPEADAEVILMATEALSDLSIPDLTVDLGLPTLVPAICADLGIDLTAGDGSLRAALNQKDSAAIAAVGGKPAQVLGVLLDAVGTADRALRMLAKLNLPAAAAAERDHLSAVAALVHAHAPSLKLTVDTVESRGYEYHTGVTFTFFAVGARGELGRGGRYLASATNGVSAGTTTGSMNGGGGESEGEPATGVTLFLDAVIRALPAPEAPARVFLPAGTEPAVAARLRAEGWRTVMGLEAAANPAEEALSLGCSQYFDGAKVRRLDGKD